MAVQTATTTKANSTTRGGKGSEQSARGGARGGAAKSARATANSGDANATSTGERDENYALISIMYHALQGAETCAQYIRDAEAAGDAELIEFFGEVCDEERERSERAKALLAARLAADIDDEDTDEDTDEEDEHDDED